MFIVKVVSFGVICYTASVTNPKDTEILIHSLFLNVCMVCGSDGFRHGF